MNPAEFAIKNRLISTLVILLSLGAGWMAYENMPRYEDPEFTIRTAQIITRYPGATPEEVANEVTEALETAVQQLQEVEEIRSTSSAGVSLISVDIKYEFSPSKDDLQILWGKVRNKVSDAAGQLPPGASEPVVNDDYGDVYGLYYLITGPGFSAKEITDYAKALRTDLLAVDGVGKVEMTGIQKEGIYVEISRERAAALGVSVDAIYNDLAQQNSVIPAGDVAVGSRRVVIQPSGEIDSVSAIENVVVSIGPGGALVRLKDIGTVTRKYQEPGSFRIRMNGKAAIALGVSPTSGGNVVAIGQAIDRKLAETMTQRPYGIEVHESYHQGKIVDASVKDFALNVVLALGIVLVTLLIFMGLQSAVVIGAVLILTVAATLATMYLVGIPMHRISLGALIIALGMLVDNAIVVTEGILVGTQQGRKKLEVAKDIVTRTKWPLLGGTIVGILAFAPIGFAPGSTAEYTGDLFWVVMISLFFSWIFAITAVPLFADLLFSESIQKQPEGDTPEGQFITAFKRFMNQALLHRWLVIGSVVGFFALSIWGFQFVKSGFFPASTTPQIVVDLRLPEGTDFAETEREMSAIEGKLQTLSGVVDVQALIGAGTLRYMLVYSPEPRNSAYGQFLLKTDSYDVISQLMPQIQDMLDQDHPNAQAKVWRFQLGPGGGSKIEAEFSGPDPAVLRQLAMRAKSIMASDGGAISIKDDWGQPVSVIEPVYSESRGRRVGVSREDMANALQTNFSGRAIGTFREGEDLIPIIARAPENERLRAENMGGIQVTSHKTGLSVPLLETVDQVGTVWRDANLLRVNRVWTINAQSDPLPSELASELLARLRPQIEAIDLPPGYQLEWGGEYGDSAESNEELASTIPYGLLAMVLTVVILFNALKQPAIIWLVVPLALIGVVVGLIATGTALEFMALLGLLSLSGLLIKNAIVLVDQMDLEISEGKPRFEAVIDSAAGRVRPVMMGALTTVLGVLPLFGDAFFKSMAVVLVFGLTFATLLTLVVVPALYAVFFNISSDERVSP